MKRVSALVIAMLMAVTMIAPAAFAAKDAPATGLKIEQSTPTDGAKGVSVENLSVKLTMNKEMANVSQSQKANNLKALTLTDPKGKSIPLQAYYSKDYPNQVMVVSAVSNTKDNRFDSATEYTLTIGKAFTSEDGTTLGEDQKISFTTLNQKRSMGIYMVLMALMMVGMVIFTTRSTKKAMEKKMAEETGVETVNPYKEAKRTGKSVKEIVEKDMKEKAKAAEAAAKQREAILALEEEVAAEQAKLSNKRVASRRPISEAGSDYKVKVQKPEHKKSTNPKGQTGKQKNKKSGNKKK